MLIQEAISCSWASSCNSLPFLLYCPTNMNFMNLDYRRLLKLSGIVFGILLAIVLLMNNIVMPLYTEQGRITKVPSVVGLNVENAREVLTQAGLTPREAETRVDK